MAINELPMDKHSELCKKAGLDVRPVELTGRDSERHEETLRQMRQGEYVVIAKTEKAG